MDQFLLVNGERLDYEKTAVSWARINDVAYLPSTVVPIGPAKNGLPDGARIVGPYLDDLTPLCFAKLIAVIIGQFIAPPGFE
jgi:amidase